MINHAYEIHTKRLIIRCYKPSDAKALKEAVDSSLEHLLPWMPRAKNEPEELSQKVARMRKYRGQFDLNIDYTYGVFEKDNKTLVGSSGLHTRVGESSLEIGYRIRQSHIGKGYATEVTKALTKTGFEMLGIDCIEIHCDERNERSANIPAKLGFKKEASIRVSEKNNQGDRKQKQIWKLFQEDYSQSPITDNILWYDETGSSIKPILKHCIIVHGCPSDDSDPTYNKHRIPWIKSQLESKGYTVDTPLMPKPWLPVYEDYKKVFDQYEVTENTILIGHSCGCAFLVRWLGETNQRIKKLILVAPWKINDEGDEYREDFYGYEIDPTLKERIGEIVMFTADNEDPEGKESLKIYHEALGGKIINNLTYGHYTLNDMGTNEFEQLVTEISK